jgi:hypothetical protein
MPDTNHLTQGCKSIPLAETQKLPSIPAPEPDELQRLINQAFFNGLSMAEGLRLLAGEGAAILNET